MISANSGIKAESATGSGVLRLKAGYEQSAAEYRYLSLYAKKMGNTVKSIPCFAIYRLNGPILGICGRNDGRR